MRKTLLESINSLPQPTQKIILSEAPHFGVLGMIPDELAFLRLGNFIDLGLEDWADDYTAWAKALVGNGIRVPDTNLRLKVVAPGQAVLEPAVGDEVVFPKRWMAFVQVIDTGVQSPDDAIRWFGMSVRQDRQPWDLGRYEPDGQGWRRVG